MLHEAIQKLILGILIFHLLGPVPLRAAPQAAAPPSPPAREQQTPPMPPTPPVQAPEAGPEVPIALHLENADLLQVIGIIASELKINYVVDPEVKGTVIINTLGEVRRADLFPLLQMILRINGATAVQTGNFYRIVPLKEIQRMPLEPLLNPQAADLSEDDRMVMNVLPLQYVSAADMTKILTPFLSEGGHLFSQEAGNILILTDSSQSMKRLLELVALFDSEAFHNQRVRLYPVKNSQAGKVVEELRQVFAAYGLSTESSAIRFVAIERINSILVVTGNPSSYPEVERWLERLDQPVPESGIRTFVYKVENGKATDLAAVLSQVIGLRTPVVQALPAGGATPSSPVATAIPLAPQAAATPVPFGAIPSGAETSHIRIVPDSINNFLVIQATTQEYEQIRQMLQELDVVPRQVMIEAKVYEVDLTDALSAGVSAFLQRRDAANPQQLAGGERKPQIGFGASAGGVASLTASLGTLVGKTRELVTFLAAAETRSQARVISAPSILASDNLPASINVGTEIPVLTSQALVSGAQAGGTSLFTNTIQNRDTGVILTITPRINSSGLVTLQIQQEVSAPLAPATGGIQSPSIQKRSVSTQAVVQDKETIALGGIIQETNTLSKNRIPLLGDIPYLGALFGNTSRSTQRTELIILLTPTVIRDAAEARNAAAEFRNKLRDLRKLLQQEEEKSEPPPLGGKAAPPAGS